MILFLLKKNRNRAAGAGNQEALLSRRPVFLMTRFILQMRVIRSPGAVSGESADGKGKR